MSNPYRANQYKNISVQTATKGQVLIMLYEAAIRHLKRAISCIDKKDVTGKGEAVLRAHDIVNELANTLDFKTGGDIAKNLEQLYNFIVRQLIDANVENRKEPLESCVRILETLLEGWRVAVKEVESQQGSQRKT